LIKKEKTKGKKEGKINKRNREIYRKESMQGTRAGLVIDGIEIRWKKLG
jgi:hypothetical protein